MSDSSENEMKTEEPKGVKTRASVLVTKFLDPTTTHDRVVIVEETKFYVESKLLIDHSEYFSAMFTGNFAERDKKEIKVNVIGSEDFKDFLLAIINPDMFPGDREKLMSLIKTCSYFQADPILMKILEKKSCDKFRMNNYEKLLKLARDNGIVELKVKVEEMLVDRFADFPQRELLLPVAIEFKLGNVLDIIENKVIINATSYVPVKNLLNRYAEENLTYFDDRIKKYENMYIQTLSNNPDIIFEKHSFYMNLVKCCDMENLEKVLKDTLIGLLKKKTLDDVIGQKHFLVAQKFSEKDKDIKKAMFEAFISFLERKKRNGKLDSIYIDMAFQFIKQNLDIQIYIINYLIDDFKSNNTISNIKYAIDGYSYTYGFKELIAETFTGRPSTDPLFTQNKKEFDRLSDKAKSFIFDCMRKKPK